VIGIALLGWIFGSCVIALAVGRAFDRETRTLEVRRTGKRPSPALNRQGECRAVAFLELCVVRGLARPLSSNCRETSELLGGNGSKFSSRDAATALTSVRCHVEELFTRIEHKPVRKLLNIHNNSAPIRARIVNHRYLFSPRG
jgi:hypothetical protein